MICILPFHRGLMHNHCLWWVDPWWLSRLRWSLSLLGIKYSKWTSSTPIHQSVLPEKMKVKIISCFQYFYFGFALQLDRSNDVTNHWLFNMSMCKRFWRWCSGWCSSWRCRCFSYRWCDRLKWFSIDYYCDSLKKKFHTKHLSKHKNTILVFYCFSFEGQTSTTIPKKCALCHFQYNSSCQKQLVFSQSQHHNNYIWQKKLLNVDQSITMVFSGESICRCKWYVVFFKSN